MPGDIGFDYFSSAWRFKATKDIRIVDNAIYTSRILSLRMALAIGEGVNINAVCS
jgi:hypothetical protein